MHICPPGPADTTIQDSRRAPFARFIVTIRHKGRPWASVICDQAIVSGTSFATSVFIGRSLGKSQLGLYVLTYSLVVVLLELHNSFISSPYTIRHARLDPVLRAEHTGSALLVTLAFSLLVSISFLSAGESLASIVVRPDMANAFLCLSLIAIPLLLKEFGRRVCFAHFDNNRAVLLDSLASFFQLAGLLVLSRLRWLSVRNAYVIVAAASLLAGIQWLACWSARINFTRCGPRRLLSDTWTFGLLVVAGNLASIVPQQLFPWLLAWLRGPSEAGGLAACVGLLSMINPLISAVGNYLGPASAATRDNRELGRIILQSTAMLFFVNCAFCGAVILLGNRALSVLYGSQYVVDIHVLTALAASSFVSNCTLPLGFGFWAIGRPDINLRINAVSTVVTLVIGPWLVHSYGLMGAAIGLLLGNGVVSFLRVLLLRPTLSRVRTRRLLKITDLSGQSA
jgi:O-antigen/teichoic acid export membrane protein